MTAIYKKELKSFFTNPMGCIFIAFVLLMMGIYTVAVNFMQLLPNFEYAVYSAVIVFPFLVPILTMRSLAEEKRQKTEQLLLSAPVRISAIVLGKYFAMLTIVLIPILITCVLPLILSAYGTISFAPAYSALLAFFCLGAALTAIGMFISSLTENQIIAAVVSLAVMLLLYFMKSLAQMMSASALISLLVFAIAAVCIACVVYIMTSSKTAAIAVGIVLMLALALLYSMYPSALEQAFTALLSNLAIFSKMDNFFYGILDVNALVYFISAAALFVFFTVQSIEKRRWN
jgi:ABC-2 type transport system permease protein